MSSGAGSSVLGISADFHDAAAAVLVDGALVAAVEQERFSRIKHDPSLPIDAIAYCLEAAALGPKDLDTVAFYEKPLTAYERILSTQAGVGPRGFRTLAAAVSSWSRRKLWIGYRIERALRQLGYDMPRLVYAEHHQSHAAAAFYASPFDHAAILTVDGVGEWATSTIAWGSGHRIELLRQMDFPDSLGLFYSAMTAFCGFAVNDGEYKLMGLAPYGVPRFVDVLTERVISVHDDGSVRLDQRWFDYRAGDRMTRPRLARLLDGPACELGAEPGQREADIAASVQVVLERSLLAMAAHAHALTDEPNVCLAGGVAWNCVANGRLLREGPFDDVWVQPAAGDSGGALGAALWSWHQLDDHHRTPSLDFMAGGFTGPDYPRDRIRDWLTENSISFEAPDPASVAEIVADALADGQLVGWFEGRAEFGPRALGHRSILADPRHPSAVQRINAAVKGREGFRPFAPAVTLEDAADWFELDRPSPYMLFTTPVAAKRRHAGEPEEAGDHTSTFADRLARQRSDISAATHVDHSARVQTVDSAVLPGLHGILRSFERRTGCPVLLNTSFNRRDEPIVLTPSDAVRCFDAAGLDLLVLEGLVIRRNADRATTS